MVVVPGPTAVATAALAPATILAEGSTAGLLEVQVTAEDRLLCRPVPLAPMATRLTVGLGCPSSGIVIDCEPGKIDRDETVEVAGPLTVKVAAAVTTLLSGLPEAMAVMAVVPGVNPVTITGVPVTAPCVVVQGPGGAHTVATAGLLEYQVTV